MSVSNRTKSAIITALVSTLMVLISLSATDLKAVTPSLSDEIPSQEEIALYSEFNEKYTPTGLALRLREIKQKKIQAIKLGVEEPLLPVSVDIPVFVGSFSDNAHLFDSSVYQELLFGTNPTGSMADYYNEVSYGGLTLTGQVYGPYSAAETQTYYMGTLNGMSSSFPTNVTGFVYSILDAADPGIDFGQYDNDGPDGTPNSGDDDGLVDALMFIHPDGAWQVGDTNFATHFGFMWWRGASDYVTDDARSGGGFITIDQYTMQPGEIGDGTEDSPSLIGGFCHELGHVFGLPDQYDGDGTSRGVGTWCIMGTGSAGACACKLGADTPTHLCAWCKADLGFVVPTVVEGTQAVSLPPVETNPVVYQLWDDAYQGSRYFLLENRTKTGFDSDIEGEGVLVWHCNEDAAYDNKEDSFRFLDLEEADGLDDMDNKVNVMDDGDPFPGSTNKTSFNDATYPSAVGLDGTPTGVSAESFAYTAGPGSDVTVTLTQRSLMGYTLSYHSFHWMSGWGTASPTVVYGATRFTAGEEGTLVGIQAGLKKNQSYDYQVRIFENMVGGAPQNLQSTTSGTFPSVTSKRYFDIPLSDSMPVGAGESFLLDVGFGPVTYGVPWIKKRPASQQSFRSLDGSSYTLWDDRDILLRARIRTTCCLPPTVGDADQSGGVDITDISVLIDNQFLTLTPLVCEVEGDVDYSGVVDITDLSILIDNQFLTLTPLPPCP